MSDAHAETVEPGCATETRSAVKSAAILDPSKAMEIVGPSKPMEATGVKSEAGEPAERIAVAVIRPVVVTRRAFGIVTATRPDTAGAVIRGQGVSGWADRERVGCARRRSAQHGRGRERGCRVWCSRGWYRDDLRADRDRPDEYEEEGE